MLQLHRQNMRLSVLLRQFKNSDEDYRKIRYTAKQTVRNVLSDNRQLLKFALLSLIELLRADPIKFNFLIHDMPSPLTMSKSVIIGYPGGSSEYNIKPLFYSNQNSYTETLTEVITNGAASLYEKMLKDFTNETMTNAAAESSTNLLPPMIYSNEQTQTLLAYRHKTDGPEYTLWIP